MGTFHFKHFSIDDTGCGMKIGTDAVLLGAWSPIPNTGRALDVGTGSGVIAMMLAQRNKLLKIIGVEIEQTAVERAERNVASSPFASKIKIINDDFKVFATANTAKFNLIISNPPFFHHSHKASESKTNLAKHNISLSYDELLCNSKNLLDRNGFVSVIIPSEQYNHFICLAATNNLYPIKTMLISHSPSKKPVRALVCLSSNYLTINNISYMTIRNSDDSWSNEYLKLTRNFYLFA